MTAFTSAELEYLPGQRRLAGADVGAAAADTAGQAAEQVVGGGCPLGGVGGLPVEQLLCVIELVGIDDGVALAACNTSSWPTCRGRRGCATDGDVSNAKVGEAPAGDMAGMLVTTVDEDGDTETCSQPRGPAAGIGVISASSPLAKG